MSAPHRPILIGVDPGISGAIAFYNFEAKILEAVHDMPVIKKQNGRNEIDGFALTQIVDRYYARCELVVIEEVSSMPRDGGVQAFAFGYATGLVTGVLSGFNLPITRTPASVWKMLCGLTHDKTFSRITAAKVFPDFAEKFKRKKDDGRAEAAMLAKFGERFLGYGDSARSLP